jgi:hypothetical protein
MYFSARKPPDALVTVNGVTGGAVSKAALGETLDGSGADETLDLFTVKFDGDALFGEGACSFTLELTEPDKQPKAVKVSAAVRPNLTGIAIFHRTADGTLARITAANAADHANTLYAGHKAGSFPVWGIDFVYVQNLSTALKWLDNYALSGTGADNMAEYLVRVEADEKMPKTLLTCKAKGSINLAEYIRIRIRGYDGERNITHDPLNTHNGSVNKGGDSLSANQAFLSIGPQSDASYVPNHLAVHLEQNITINAVGGGNPHFPNHYALPFIVSMIAVSRGNTLVMEAGSKLTNYMYEARPSPYESYDHTAVHILPGGVFEWQDGEISNILGHGNLVLCAPAGGGVSAGEFYYYGQGDMYGNTADQIAVGSYWAPDLYAVTDPRFAP